MGGLLSAARAGIGVQMERLEAFLPEVAARVADSVPIDLDRVDQALQELMRQVEEEGDSLVGWLEAGGAAPWLFGMALAAGVYLAANRRRRSGSEVTFLLGGEGLPAV